MNVSANVASGDLVVNNEDLSVAGTGPRFKVDRSWNSLGSETMNERFGYGWNGTTGALSISSEYNGAVFFKTEEGVYFTFVKKGKNYTTPRGIRATLCGKESEKPCTSLPVGVGFRLTYDQSQVHYDFSAEGIVLDEQDRYGNTITTSQEIGEANGQQQVTDTQGRHFIYQWNKNPEEHAEQWLEELSDVTGARATKYGYETGANKHRHLTSYKDAAGHETKYGYTGDLLTRITTPTGHVTKIEYDANNRIKAIVRTDNTEHTTGPSTTFTYYALGSAPSPCTSTQKATVVKDSDGNDGKTGHTTTYCANVLDEVEKTIDASGNVTEGSYNPVGNMASTTASAPGSGESGNVESLGYDESGLNLMCVVTGTSTKTGSCPSRPDKTALVTSYSYKDKANPFSSTQVENPESHSTFSCFNHGEQEESEGHKCPASEAEQPAGSLQNKNDPLSSENEMKFSYNTNGTTKTSTDADGHTTNYAYDEKGNLKEIKPPAPLSPTTITVDADSRPHVITDGAGHIETITYDSAIA
jgi:YD repeat-containing protein